MLAGRSELRAGGISQHPALPSTVNIFCLFPLSLRVYKTTHDITGV
jgi:hypothetical protein